MNRTKDESGPRERPSIALLRSLVAAREGAPQFAQPGLPTGITALDEYLPWGGLPGGSLTELFYDEPYGAGAWRFAALLLVQATRAGSAALIDPRPELFPPALAVLGVALDRLLIVTPPTPRLGLWALEELIRTPALSLTVAALRGEASPPLRRLQLGAEAAGTRLLLLRSERELRGGPGAALRLRIRAILTPARRARALCLEVLRCRGAPPIPPLTLELDGATGALAASALLPE